nr:hypothetical protein [Tanacetum cinerariifolium]
MQIDKLYKFSDGTLNDVRNALDDRLKGIRMQYLPTIIWRRGDKDRASAMIQAIKMMLKTRRILRSLEKFVGGRLEIVTYWFTLIVLSDLRHSDNENMLSLLILILRSILMDLQNKDKKNILMRIDELHKFSDGTLNDVRNALDDRLKGIRMQYLPATIWRKGDKDRAAAMIQAIEKMLKMTRIMRSLEKFVGGRLYDGDLRMLKGPYDFIICCFYFNRGHPYSNLSCEYVYNFNIDF